jgi:hypothetical protein
MLLCPASNCLFPESVVYSRISLYEEVLSAPPCTRRTVAPLSTNGTRRCQLRFRVPDSVPSFLRSWLLRPLLLWAAVLRLLPRVRLLWRVLRWRVLRTLLARQVPLRILRPPILWPRILRPLAPLILRIPEAPESGTITRREQVPHHSVTRMVDLCPCVPDLESARALGLEVAQSFDVRWAPVVP